MSSKVILTKEDLEKDLKEMSIEPNYYKIDNNSIEYRLQELEMAELGETSYAKELKKILSSIKNDRELFDMKSSFPGAIILSWNNFYKILKKYNLAVGLIEDYERVIPDENINDLIRFSKVTETETDSGSKINYWKKGRIELIKEIEINSKKIKNSELKKIIEFIGRLPIYQFINGYLSIENCEELEIIREYREKSSLFFISNSSITINNRWLIAAPIEDMQNNVTIRINTMAREKRRESITEDPIVFKATKLGVIIVTAWGKEAEDDVFKAYKI